MVIRDWLAKNYVIDLTIKNEQYLQWALFIATFTLINVIINRIKRFIKI